MTPRAVRALAIMKAGGCYRTVLETSIFFMGRNQIERRTRKLFDVNGERVRGFAESTLRELAGERLIERVLISESEGIYEYRLKKEKLTPPSTE